MEDKEKKQLHEDQDTEEIKASDEEVAEEAELKEVEPEIKEEAQPEAIEEKKEVEEAPLKEEVLEKPKEAAKSEHKVNEGAIKKFRTISPQKPRRERVETKKEFDEKVLEIKRVARVVKGGRRFKFRAAVVIGNHNGKVGFGLGKGSEVTTAVSKAVAKAKKRLMEVPITDGTIPYDIKVRFKGASILMRPAPKGTGIVAGGPVRIVAELVGITDISAKMLGSSNKVNNMMAVFEALKGIVRDK